MKKFIEEFKAFALKGNVIDLAIGVVIGGAFSTIVKSLVNDIIMPLVGLLLGGVNFTTFHIVLKEATATHKAVVLNVGNFIQNVVNFLIIAITIFICIKLASKLYKKKDAPPAKKPDDVVLLEQIRDLLQAQNGSVDADVKDIKINEVKEATDNKDAK
ncbi:MAG: large-conductance mechanosensitive channel protein MscL [Sarcina sp.]